MTISPEAMEWLRAHSGAYAREILARIEQVADVAYRSSVFDDSDEIAEDNIKYIDPHTHKIDILSDVRDYLILNVPMKRTHDEDDENCRQVEKSGQDENKEINPVWEKLTKNKNNYYTSDKALRALNISITTSTERLNVDAFYLPHEK